ncbi:ORF6N domain-containing protein [Fibrobacter sp. UBA2449]|uniref:ORF6N domain-containing protein n=1 Tax=Fibrobacter sp. UBA2449 TaxID=1946529 RepID=UPI0025B95415|nr:ORF6N domain-containing protein [Fibrobacter sp. UBA2449]
MKKEVAVAQIKPGVSLIDENLLKSRIYTIRGVKVMLDADLAEIYGYETRFFNRQVKNNIERFAEDFRFQLTEDEMQNLMCKNCTSSWGGTRKRPFAFTEQGIYMLMTVLKGDLAIQQSMALIRLFKKMKDYIIHENRPLLESDGIAQVAAHTIQNTKEIAEIRQDVSAMKTDLQKVMTNFIDPSTHKHFLILNGQKLEADIAYTQIYGMARKSVIIVDNYMDVKTLDLLRCVAKGVTITIVSDQYGQTRLTDSMRDDFKATRPDVVLEDVKPAGNIFHDRYIYLDCGTPDEKLFHCGASSKDAGNKITTIVRLEDVAGYKAIFERFMTP